MMLIAQTYNPGKPSIKVPFRWTATFREHTIADMDYFQEPCPYLPGRTFRFEVIAGRLAESNYDTLLGEGWRRSGQVFYRTRCDACSLCIPLRRPASALLSSRGRRLVRANADLKVKLVSASFSDERFNLYLRYLQARHSPAEDVAESFLALVDSSLARLVEYRLEKGGSREGRLVALGFVDETPRSLSSVYFAFDPDDARRSLGSYSVFAETSLAESLCKSRYYLGFWVPGSHKMEYKADFPPFELFLDHGTGKGTWMSFSSKSQALSVAANMAATDMAANRSLT